MLRSSAAPKVSSPTLVACSTLTLLACLVRTAPAEDRFNPASPQRRSGAGALTTAVVPASHPALGEAATEPVPAARDGLMQTGADEETWSDERLRVLEKGTSSRAARKAALDALPLEAMTSENRARAHEVLDSVGLFRQLPAAEFEVDPRVYRFFISHPEVAVAIWQAMGISKFQMTQTGPEQYQADAGDGTQGVVHVLLRGDEHNVIVCDGVFASPLLVKPIRSKALLHLQTAFHRDEAGRTLARHRLKLFVSFPSGTVEAAAKIISPVSNIIVDRNFREVSLFVHLMSAAMARQPGWIERVASRFEGIPQPRTMQFLKLSAEVYVSARQREAAARGEAVTIDEILEPLRPREAKSEVRGQKSEVR